MNEAILVGRLTKDPVVRSTQSSTVANFTLAINRRPDKDGVVEADFIPVVAWGKQAELVEKYVKKGNRLGVTGRIQTRSWTDDKKVQHYVTEIVMEDVEFLTPKYEQSGGGGASTSSRQASYKDYEQVVDDDLPF